MQLPSTPVDNFEEVPNRGRSRDRLIASRYQISSMGPLYRRCGPAYISRYECGSQGGGRELSSSDLEFLSILQESLVTVHLCSMHLSLQFFLATFGGVIQQSILEFVVATSRPFDHCVTLASRVLLCYLCGGSGLARRHLDYGDSEVSCVAERWKRIASRYFICEATRLARCLSGGSLK